MRSLLALPGFAALVTAQYSATYSPSNAPDHTEDGQSGTNKCGTGSSQSSMCQNAYLNSVDDFCLFAPPEPGASSTIGETERIEVSWCTQSGRGTRLIPNGTLQGVHFVKTPDYVQVTGVGDLTKLNIPSGDAGGELDPHGADGNGNPIGGLVFSDAFGSMVQLHEWTNFMSADEFCFRGCKDGPNAPALCQHIYDVMGCQWNMPGNYDPGVFEECAGDTGEPMGVYGTSTFHQGDAVTPDAHPAPSSSQCSSVATINDNATSSGGASTTSSGGTASATTTSTLNSTSNSRTTSVDSSRSDTGTSATLVSGLTATRTASAASDAATNAASSQYQPGMVPGGLLGVASFVMTFLMLLGGALLA